MMQDSLPNFTVILEQSSGRLLDVLVISHENCDSDGLCNVTFDSPALIGEQYNIRVISSDASGVSKTGSASIGMV